MYARQTCSCLDSFMACLQLPTSLVKWEYKNICWPELLTQQHPTAGSKLYCLVSFCNFTVIGESSWEVFSCSQSLSAWLLLHCRLCLPYLMFALAIMQLNWPVIILGGQFILLQIVQPGHLIKWSPDETVGLCLVTLYEVSGLWVVDWAWSADVLRPWCMVTSAGWVQSTNHHCMRAAT